MPAPVACCHQVSVWRSYMIRLLYRSRPVVPKSSTWPSNARWNPIAVLHSGQNVTEIGTPPTSSLTISCQVSTCKGYALAAPPASTSTTGSSSPSQPSASATETNCGLSMAGMPSLGGPPDSTSLYGTVWRAKSVLNSRPAPRGAGSSASSSGSVTAVPGAGAATSKTAPPARIARATARIVSRIRVGEFPCIVTAPSEGVAAAAAAAHGEQTAAAP